MGNEPNKFLRELMRRARTNHKYKVVVCGCYAPWDAVKQRCLRRATEEGRHAALGFVRKQHVTIFPGGGGEESEGAAAAISTAHHDKFAEELLPGDERYLFDNSAPGSAPPTLHTHDVL